MNQAVIPLAEPWLPPDCAEAVKRQVETTFVGPGAVAQSFATKLAETCGTRAAVTVASGTVALSIAAKVLGLQHGDEVVVPSYGVISVINGFASIGLQPRLAEIDRRTGCIDPEKLSDAITPRTKAVCYIDFCASIGSDLDAVFEVCRERGIPLIEDAAWALGRGSAGKRGGGTGTIATLSFSVPKLITTGQGGAVLANSDAHRDAAVRLADHGDLDWRRTNLNRGIGSNLRLSDLSASLGLAQCNKLAERMNRKRRAFTILSEILGDRLFRAADGDFPFQNIVFVEQPDDVVAKLRTFGVLAARQYRALYQHPPYCGLRDRSFPAAEFWTDCAVYLPFGVAMTEDDAARVGSAVASLNCRFLDWR